MTKISSAEPSKRIATSTSDSLSAFHRCAKPTIAATVDLLIRIKVGDTAGPDQPNNNVLVNDATWQNGDHQPGL